MAAVFKKETGLNAEIVPEIYVHRHAGREAVAPREIAVFSNLRNVGRQIRGCQTHANSLLSTNDCAQSVEGNTAADKTAKVKNIFFIAKMFCCVKIRFFQNNSAENSSF